MFDSFNRRINYLRISVTDRCNLRCTYCMPAEGIELIPRERILKFTEIAEITRIAVGMGVTKVRITGGEPLVRRRIVELVGMIARIDGVEDFGMTSNAIALSQFARPLFDAGLQRLNISLDTVDPQGFRELTRCGELADAIAGIDAAIAAGFDPIKLNCVIEASSAEPDARGVRGGTRVAGALHPQDEPGHRRVLGGGGRRRRQVFDLQPVAAFERRQTLPVPV
jgi:cyclic pyranopterin phosphate synthase